VYSIEAPEQNVTAYDGLDACGGNDWRVDDVSNTATFDEDSSHTNDQGHTQTQILTRLKPNTQYAFYVKTYSLTKLSRYGGQSPIQYFTTLPSRPSPPINLRASSNHHSELLVQWGTPVHPNGNLSYFLVLGQWIPDDHEFLLEQRDYCINPMTPEEGEESAHILSSQSGPQSSCCNHHRPTPVSQASTQHIPSLQLQSLTKDCIAKCGLVSHGVLLL
jgi:insulin receptor